MRCPICQSEFEPDKSSTQPFCSERCRTIDLGRWLDESYTMPVFHNPDEEPPAEDDAAGESGGMPPSRP